MALTKVSPEILDLNNTAGTSNVRLGVNAGNSIVSGGNYNVVVGDEAGTAITTGANNTAVGYLSLTANTTGTGNSAVGRSALGSNTTGSGNAAFGAYWVGNVNAAMAVNTTGASNSAFGAGALSANTTAANNTAVGFSALGANTTGASNTAVGYAASDTTTTGLRNVCIGDLSGAVLTTGSDNILIGSATAVSASGAASQYVMGSGVTSAGNSNFTFGSGTTDSNIAFGATTITAPSDVRLKEDIQDEEVGLGFINDLRPVTFQWKKEKDIPEEMKAHVAGSEKRTMNGKHNHGFIAQEVKAVIDNHNMKDGFDMWTEDGSDGRQRLGDASLMPIMVKALQELSAKNDALEARLTTLEA